MNRPRVKPEHAPYRVGADRIRIGGASYGIAAEITDQDGLVWTLLQAMDGTHSVADIVNQAVRSHPDRPQPVVRAAVDQLVRSGYVEDAAAPDPSGLTERD